MSTLDNPHPWPSPLRTECSLCGGEDLEVVMALNDTPIANQFMKEKIVQDVFPLQLLMCEQCKHVQIGHVLPSEYLFNDYVYATSTSKVTLTHLYEEAASIRSWHKEYHGHDLGSESLMFEIGSNDGAMLKIWKEIPSIGGPGRVLGIDPAINIAKKANDEGLNTVIGYFSSKTAPLILEQTNGKKADVIIANNVLAHVPNVRDVLRGISSLLSPRGTLVFEVSYLYDMVEFPVFDTIYHEHMSYHTVGPLAVVMDGLGIPIRHVERIGSQVGRGSLRVYATPGNGSSLDNEVVRAYMLMEAKTGLYGCAFYQRLWSTIQEQGDVVRAWLEKIIQGGHKIVGYGAPAKMTTLMYAFDLDADLFKYVVDDSKWKQGLFTPGKHIPIIAPSILSEENRKTSCFIFAWNFATSIIANNRGFKGKWIVPLPGLEEFPRTIFRSGSTDFERRDH